MRNMVVGMVDKIPSAFAVNAVLCEIEHAVHEGADVCQAVQLVEDGDVVLRALRGLDAGLEIVLLGLVDYDEAISSLDQASAIGC